MAGEEKAESTRRREETVRRWTKTLILISGVHDGGSLCIAGETGLQTHKPTDTDSIPPRTQHIQTLILLAQQSFDVLLLTVSLN